MGGTSRAADMVPGVFIRADMPCCAPSVVPVSGIRRVSIAVLCAVGARPGHWVVWAEEGMGR